MSEKDASSVDVGGSVRIISKKSRLREFRRKFSSMTFAHKLLFLTCVLLVVLSLSLVTYKVFNKTPAKIVVPDNQEVDQAAADAALEKIQKDPSALPSGKFHPEKGDTFRRSGGANNGGTVEQ